MITTEHINSALVVSLKGQINSSNAAEIQQQLLQQVSDAACRWLVDFSSLEYISSAGLRVVLLLAKRIREHQGTLVLCQLQPHVYEVFEVSGFLSLLTVVDTRQQGLSLLAA